MYSGVSCMHVLCSSTRNEWHTHGITAGDASSHLSCQIRATSKSHGLSSKHTYPEPPFSHHLPRRHLSPRGQQRPPNRPPCSSPAPRQAVLRAASRISAQHLSWLLTSIRVKARSRRTPPNTHHAHIPSLTLLLHVLTVLVPRSSRPGARPRAAEAPLHLVCQRQTDRRRVSRPAQPWAPGWRCKVGVRAWLPQHDHRGPCAWVVLPETLLTTFLSALKG